MRIQYISDIHLELLHKKKAVELISTKIQPKSEICILAGDIGNPLHSNSNYKDFLLNVSEKFKKTFVIAGNHEFYGNDIEQTKQEINKICMDIPNVSFLDNSYEDYDGYRWIGSTQWTKIENPQFIINDFSQIKNLSVNRYNNIHLESYNFLLDTLSESSRTNTKSIVITHHLPIYGLTHNKYRGVFFEKYSQCFNANFDELIKSNNSVIQGWFYGHTHERSVQKHHDVMFYCNPVGYSGENNYSDFNIVCDLDL